MNENEGVFKGRTDVVYEIRVDLDRREVILRFPGVGFAWNPAETRDVADALYLAAGYAEKEEEAT